MVIRSRAFRSRWCFPEKYYAAFRWGMALMMVLIACFSAFVKNTPVVAVFIPVVIQIGTSTGVSPKQMLIPLSFASIIGG